VDLYKGNLHSVFGVVATATMANSDYVLSATFRDISGVKATGAMVYDVLKLCISFHDFFSGATTGAMANVVSGPPVVLPVVFHNEEVMTSSGFSNGEPAGGVVGERRHSGASLGVVSISSLAEGAEEMGAEGIRSVKVRVLSALAAIWKHLLSDVQRDLVGKVRNQHPYRG